MYFLAFFSVVASYSNLSTVFNGCKDKGFMGIWYTTGKVLTKKHAYYCKISIFTKKVRRYPIAALP